MASQRNIALIKINSASFFIIAPWSLHKLSVNRALLTSQHDYITTHLYISRFDACFPCHAEDQTASPKNHASDDVGLAFL